MGLKNYLCLFLPVLLLYSLCAPAQVPIGVNWDYTYGGGYLQAMELTSDGGYVLAGMGIPPGSPPGVLDAAIVKLNTNGTVVWAQQYGTSTLPSDEFYDIRQTADGGYIAVGKITGHPSGKGLWVLKTDANGMFQWEQTYSTGMASQWLHAIVQTSDGGYVATGYSGVTGFEEVLVMKLSANGTLQWQKTYGGSGQDRAFDIKQTSDGGYIVGAQTDSNDGDIQQNHGMMDIWVLKLDASGNLVWEQTYGGTDGERVGVLFPSIIGNDFLRQTADGGYILTGTTRSNDGDVSGNIYGLGDVWLLKLNANGTIDWEKNYGGSSADGGQSVQQTLDGGYVVAAASWSSDYDVPSNQGLEDFWIFKTDPSGTITWNISLGNMGNNIPADIQQVSGCEFAVAGWAILPGGDVSQGQGFWLVNLQVQWSPPLVSSPQSFCWSDNTTLADLGVTGNNVPAGFTPIFTWYDDNLKTNILPETTLVADGENYFVTQTIDGCESPLAEVIVNVTPDTPPTAISPQSFCLDDTPEISDIGINGQNLLWYLDPNANTPTPANTGLEDGKTYYVSQTTDNCESSLLPIAVEVFPPPDIFPVPDVVACDTDGNGEGGFFLPDLDNAVSGGAANVAVSYHASLSDAENGTNALPDHHIVQDSPQIIYARVLDNATGCDSTMEIQLVFSAVPEIMVLEDLTGCDNGSGEAVFDLTENNPNILGSQNAQNLKITYHHNQTEAENGQNPIPGPENHQSGPGDVFVRLENTQTGCFDTGVFKISVLPRPDIADISIQEEFCSDLPGGDFATIDLTVYDQQINPNAPANTEVVYYENPNAHNSNQPIQTPESYTTISNPQTIIAETINTETGCPSLVFGEIEISINDRPMVDISQYDGKAICWDANPATPVHGGNYQAIVLNTGLGENEYGFAWTLNGEVLPATGPSLEAVEPGEYGVVVSDMDGTTICTSISKATIVEANPPEFRLSRTSGFVADEHGILVSEVSGIGNFEFRLDDGNWVSLEGGRLLFENVAPGTHSVYGRSLEGCGTTIKTITLIGYPKFFTPNNDGSNDRWNIIGLQEGKVYIFDRYGKLLASLDPQRQGWNGTYNGKPMPSDDYWFKVEYTEKLPDGSERKGEFKASFSLIR